MNSENQNGKAESPEQVPPNNRTLESDIIQFTTGLPYWAQILSERLLSGLILSDLDIERAYTLILEDSGINEKSVRPKISIVCKSNTGIYKDDLQMLSLSGVEGINALVADQIIEFCPNLTLIYGTNGSGKSGYVRLLNNVFITKGEKTILPNVHETIPKDKKAEFTFISDGGAYVLKFPGDRSKTEFKQFSVFDEKAVHAHLNNRNQFEFRPAGLSFFAELIEGYKRVEDLLQKDIEKHTPTLNTVDFFDGESEIKTLIQSLSAKTKIIELRKYLPFSDDDKAQRLKLEEEKARLVSLKKDKEIQELNEKKTLLNTLKGTITNLNRYFTEDQLTKASTKIEDYIEKEQLAKNYNIGNFKISILNEIGGPAWRNFIIAADTFARLQNTKESAYPQNGDVCLLCHQPLSEASISLVSSYWSFIKSKAEQDSKDAQIALDQSKDNLSKLDLNLFSDTSIIYKWLTENKPKELKILSESLKQQIILREELIKDISDKKNQVKTPIQVDTIIIDDINKDIDTRIHSLQETETIVAIAKLQGQIVFLNHKEKLSDHFATIEKAVSNMERVVKANKIKPQISKREITNKEKELSAQYFNQAYIDKFNNECSGLNGRFGININHTGSSGTSYRQLTLKGRQPSDVLSEGEQKVISIADFLSETILSGVNKGMIFDDPVNSLDEKRKNRIAERLIEESQLRQVIIFTHDLVFVSILISNCKDQKKEYVCHWMEQRDGKPGYISPKNAPSYEKEYRSAEIPTKFYLDAKKPEATAKDREYLIQQGFTSLRTCYEVLVINDLFANVVQRFQERVSVDSLKSVNFDATLRDEISQGFYHCCKFMEGHSHSDGFAYQKPELTNLSGEIERFNTLKAKIKKFNKEAKAA